MLPTTTLPYKDTKPQGAADFYFAINATLSFVKKRLGPDGLVRYWRELGANYYRPVTQIWQAGGFPAVAQYWRDFFAAEPGSVVEVEEGPDEVVVRVSACPAIAHLRKDNRVIVAEYCQQCFYVNQEIAEPAGLTVRVEGGAGQCVQRFFKPDSETKPQDLRAIRLCQ